MTFKQSIGSLRPLFASIVTLLLLCVFNCDAWAQRIGESDIVMAQGYILVERHSLRETFE